jgi:hypothetical protein
MALPLGPFQGILMERLRRATERTHGGSVGKTSSGYASGVERVHLWHPGLPVRSLIFRTRHPLRKGRMINSASELYKL